MKVIRIKLDSLLKEHELNRSTLSKESGISYQVVDRYYKNTVTKWDSSILLKFCLFFHCGIEDLIEIVEQ